VLNGRIVPIGNPVRFLEHRERCFIDNLLVRIHFIIAMIRWTGLAPWEVEFPFPGSLTLTNTLHQIEGVLNGRIDPIGNPVRSHEVADIS